MKEQNCINVNIPMGELAQAIADKLVPFFADLKTPPLPKNEENYLTRKEAATLLNISLPTLTEYTKKGKLIGYRIGARVIYKLSEIENSLQKIKGGRYE